MKMKDLIKTVNAIMELKKFMGKNQKCKIVINGKYAQRYESESIKDIIKIFNKETIYKLTKDTEITNEDGEMAVYAEGTSYTIEKGTMVKKEIRERYTICFYFEKDGFFGKEYII